MSAYLSHIHSNHRIMLSESWDQVNDLVQSMMTGIKLKTIAGFLRGGQKEDTIAAKKKINLPPFVDDNK